MTQATSVGLSAKARLAPAKINLALHVTGRRDDGYHDLDSLVAFAEFGDRLSVSAADDDTLDCSGPFGAALAGLAPHQNLVMRALAMARDNGVSGRKSFHPVAIALEKHLPVASGMGGGSANAAVLLRIVAESLPEIGAELRQASLDLGADVPMCFDGVPARVRGRGEIGTPLAHLPAIAILLVNPNVEVSTPEVFRRLRHRTNGALPEPPAEGFASVASLIDYLSGTRNDLQAAATEIAPAIAAISDALRDLGAGFVRMSGSGATVFGLFADEDAAKAASARLAVVRPEWWCRATRLAAFPPRSETT